MDCSVLLASGIALASLSWSTSRALARVYRLAHLEKLGSLSAILALLGAGMWLIRCYV